jgi:hypothetical protein
MISFNYVRYLFDPDYNSYYNLLRDDFMKLSVFQARGFRRDPFIRQIMTQGEVAFYSADLVYQEENEELITFSDSVYKFYSDLEKFCGRTAR